MKKITSYLFDTRKQTRELNWFRTLLYLFLLYRVTIYFFQFELLFSDERLTYLSQRSLGPIADLAYFLSNHYTVPAGLLSLVAMLFLSLSGLLKRSGYLSNTLLWLLVVNIHNFVYPTLTAGDFLLNQLLFFNIFFNPRSGSNSKINDLKTSLHNISLAGIKVQICLAYFFAAWFKVGDPSWLNGTAIYDTFHIPTFTNDLLSGLSIFVCTLLTWSTLCYQILFPVLIWLRPAKIYLLAFGVTQHLFIALGMGLFSFGIIMIICYVLFLKYDDSFSLESSKSKVSLVK